MLFAALSVVLLGSAATAPAAEEGGEKTQTKKGTVRKVDEAAKQVVVMVARGLAFTVTDSTKIAQDGQPRELSDIKVDAEVSVEYTRASDTRTAKKIEIAAKQK